MAKRRKPLPQRPYRDDGSPTPKVTVSLSRPGAAHCEHIRSERISDVLPNTGVIVWVDLCDPGPAEIDMLREEFKFHSLALEDIAKQRQRPKVDEYPGYFFVVMHAPLPQTGDDQQLETVEIDVFVGRNYVVTSHPGEVPSLTDAVHRWEKTEAELRKDVGFLLHVIADSVIDSYFPIVDRLEDRLDDIELQMFGKGSGFDAEELLAIKRTLYTLRKAIYPLREVFNTFLRRDQAIFTPETYPYFQDAYDHVLRLLDILDIERDMATGALEAQLSVVSNRLNETMRSLTVVAVVVAVMGAVFGAWGMNFDAVPLQHMGMTGFYLVGGGTIAIVAAILAVMKLWKWW
jgi:magnesium transporter